MKEKFLLLKGKSIYIPRGSLEDIMGESLWLNSRFRYYLRPLDIKVNDVYLEK